MVTPAQRLQEELKKLFQKFIKTPFAIPAAIAITAGVYYLVLAYAGSFCLSGLITPLALLGIMWEFGFKGVKKLLILGAVTALALSGVWCAYATNYYQHVLGFTASSDDHVLIDGKVDPLFGESTTQFNFTVTVTANFTNTAVTNVTLLIADLNIIGARAHNYSMILADNGTNIRHYYYVTEVSKPVNTFVFGAKVNGDWVIALNPTPDKKSPIPTAALEGPVYKDSGAVAVQLIALSLYAGYVVVFPIYALLLLMVWWTRRARRMRVEAYEKAMSEREQETKNIPKEEAKVPRLSKATGSEGEETFVCSECGADVPADAKVCPKCGEKFD
jgi:hypothetical protein